MVGKENVEKKYSTLRKYIIDIEAIQTTSSSYCYREISICNVADARIDVFYCKPCQRIDDLNEKYRKSFNFCKREIHGLCYNHHPLEYRIEDKVYNGVYIMHHTLNCGKAVEYIKHNLFQSNTQTYVIYFKGGIIEKYFMDKVLENMKFQYVDINYYMDKFTKKDIVEYYLEKDTICDEVIHGNLKNRKSWTCHCSANEVLFYYIALFC